MGTRIMLLLGALSLSGCRSVIPEPHGPRIEILTNATAKSDWRSVVVRPKTNVVRVSLCQKLNPIWWVKNADTPTAPDWYRPDKHCRTFMWHVRNPCHNFARYVVGVSDKPFVRAGRYPDRIGNPNGGWNYAVIKRKRLRLPFVSYQGKRFECYLGWRTGGDFGIAMRTHDHKK